jgi:hypothetical protein
MKQDYVLISLSFAFSENTTINLSKMTAGGGIDTATTTTTTSTSTIPQAAGDVLVAAFRHQAAFMKTWKPASIPSVRRRNQSYSICAITVLTIFFCGFIFDRLQCYYATYATGTVPSPPNIYTGRIVIASNCTLGTSKPFRVTLPPRSDRLPLPL